MQATFRPVADTGLLVAFGTTLDPDAHAAVLALDRALSDAPPDGLKETSPAMVNLMVVFDPLITDAATMQAQIEPMLATLDPTPPEGREVTVEVCYDAPFAPDLAAVASAKGLSEEAVINAHLAGEYHVLMFGFAPGYGYLGGVPDSIALPRKSSPVRDVPAGSVMIAGPQCLVSTLIMPSGWSVIGRSPTQVLTGDADAPTLYSVGDRVRFIRVGVDRISEVLDD